MTTSAIRSATNPEFRRLEKLLKSPRECRLEGLAVLEGERLVSEVDPLAHRPRLLVTTPTYQGSAGRRLESACRHVVMSESLVRRLSDVQQSQGILLLIDIPLPSPWPRRDESVILLDGIQDPGNLGTILRTAAAVGIRHIGLSQGSTFAWAPKVLRAGMGAHLRLSIHEAENLQELIERLDMPTIATTPSSPVNLYQADIAGPAVWLFGGEGAGLSEEVQSQCDLTLRIPMASGMESVNLASAVAVCLFEQLRQQAVEPTTTLRARIRKPAVKKSGLNHRGGQ